MDLIPARKSRLQQNTCILPSLHPSIYPSRVPVSPPPKIKNFKQPKPPYYPNYREMNALVDLNMCHTAVDHQLRLDRKRAIPPNYTNPFQALNNLIDDNLMSLPSLNIIIKKEETRKDLAKFLHGSCGWPVRDTFIKAIKKNHFTTWPGLDPQLISKHLPDCIATAKGHIRQEYKGLQPTHGKKKIQEIRARSE
jgi:hypothetical protein